MATMIIYLSSCVCLLVLTVIIKFIDKLWWTPISIQSKMKAQGIKGPSYKFIYGNTTEIINMRKEIMSSPTESSRHHHIFPRIHPHIYTWIKLYGTNVLSWYGAQPELIVTDPELIKEILNDKDGAYPKREPADYMKKLLGDGLVLVRSGGKWFKQRKLANHAFHGESLKSMIPAMITSVEMMLARWRQHEGKEIEVFQEFKILTSEIISRTAFGSSYLEGENIFNMLTRMTFIASRNFHTIRIPGLGKLLKSHDDSETDELEQGIHESIKKMIKKREESVKTGVQESYGNDFLGALVKAYHSADETQKISIDDVIDECKTFYIAGQETTSSLLVWTIFLLAMHADWQDKVRKEVFELFGQQNPSPDSFSRLKMMSMVINESLRLYSPVVDFLRKVKKGVKLGKYIIPVNMDIYIPIFAIHNDPKIWGEDVYLFKPERFAQGVASASTNKSMTAFLPFGSGPRTCVGLNFATAETKITLSMILQRYRFTLSPNYVHSPVQVLTVCPQHGLPVMLQAL